MEDRSEKLKAVIRDEIISSSSIPFARYMELCLYHPEYGYYMKQDSPTGRGGDFYTAPHVHRLFGATIARWMQSAAASMKLRNPRILEIGAGNGQLAWDILSEWRRSGQPTPPMELVEGGPHRRQQLRERFHNLDVLIPEPDDPDPPDPFEGFILANELLDAMPMRVVARTPEGLREIMVVYRDDSFTEESSTFDTKDPLLAKHLEGLSEGFRTEFSEGWRYWVNTAFKKLGRGAVLIIDYGEPGDSLAMPWRAGGSIRCYHEHQVDNDPYLLPGTKDITANVNFGLVEEYAADAGFKVEKLRTQSSFLVRNGLLDLLAEQVADQEEGKLSKDWLQVKNLIHDEGGMGELFKAMVLVKE